MDRKARKMSDGLSCKLGWAHTSRFGGIRNQSQIVRRQAEEHSPRLGRTTPVTAHWNLSRSPQAAVSKMYDIFAYPAKENS
jgi:hypothetical protein